MDNCINIYTDGACSGNPGPGGWAAVLVSGIHRKEIYGGYRKTTNNRMELRAVAEALKAVKGVGREITIWSDSQVFVSPFNSGKAKERLAKGQQVNADIWKEILDAAAPHKVNAVWVKGHANTKENNRCDELAVAASHNPTLVDAGYENGGETGDPVKEKLIEHFTPVIVEDLYKFLEENNLMITNK